MRKGDPFSEVDSSRFAEKAVSSYEGKQLVDGEGV